MMSSRAAVALRRVFSAHQCRTLSAKSSRLPDDKKSLKDFLHQHVHDSSCADVNATANTYPTAATVPDDEPALPSSVDQLLNNKPAEKQAAPTPSRSHNRSFFIESYGCQMNTADSEIVASIMQSAGYKRADSEDGADVILMNTCAVRENAEQKIWMRLNQLRGVKKARMLANKRGGRSDPVPIVGVLGCMAERLKASLLESDKMVDAVVGPDAYRDLPRILGTIEDGGASQVNVLLSLDETYADVAPVRDANNTVSAFVSIMRGCNNMCSYCIVPFTRGKERSRPAESILREVKQLSDEGFKEVWLLGQNVNSYCDLSVLEQDNSRKPTWRPKAPGDGQVMARGFNAMWRYPAGGLRFAELLDRVAEINPEIRVRFTSPHPKDFPDELIDVIARRPNVCKQVHIPAQAGSDTVLERMRRGYTNQTYRDLINLLKERIPGVALSSDFISGFCGETETDHSQAKQLIADVGYDHAYLFAYSQREKTHAHRHFADDVPEADKLRRLADMIDTHYALANQRSQEHIGRLHLVLVEKASLKSQAAWKGRADNMRAVVFPKCRVAGSIEAAVSNPTEADLVDVQPGDYVIVAVTAATAQTLRGVPIAKSSLVEFHQLLLTQAAHNAEWSKRYLDTAGNSVAGEFSLSSVKAVDTRLAPAVERAVSSMAQQVAVVPKRPTKL